MQVEAPAKEYVPALQGVQDAEAAEENDPAAHSKQLVDPGEAAYVPLRQVEHSALPSKEEKVPTGQSKQGEEPYENVPALQGMHGGSGLKGSDDPAK